MGQFTTGNEIVDSVGVINFTGNIVPQIWYKKILRENGKPYLLAITLLSEIVYWYRPTEIRDESSGQIIGWKKRFKEDLLQRSYAQFADIYGESKRSVTEAVICLEKLGVVKRIFRTINTYGGNPLNNVLYLELIPEKLFALTYPEIHSKQSKISDINNVKVYNSKVEDYNDEVAQNNEYPPTKFCDRVLQNFVGPITNNNVGVSRNKFTRVTSACRTNTKNNTENNIGDYNSHIIQSTIVNKKEGMGMIRYYTDLVKKNISYDELMDQYTFGERDIINDIVGVMVDVIGVKRENLFIDGAEYPYEYVKEIFLKINSEHIKYYLTCFYKNTKKIKIMKPYIRTSLFNSVNTINSYYQAKVNHDNANPQLYIDKNKDHIIPDSLL